jgi:L-alanine-DL-glutamate epimerase-like enolase superfamily enzyme
MDAPRITAIEPILIKLPLERPIEGPFGRLDARPNLLIRATLESGEVGLGEVWANFPPWGCEERVAIVRHVLAPVLVGRPLADPAACYPLMHARARLLANQWGAPGPVHQAIAGVDIALWDVHARARAVTLRDLLLGRPAPDRVPVYASGLGPHDTGGLIDRARAAGHRRFKVRVAFGPAVDPMTLADGRKAAGDAPLMADANQTLDAERLAALGPAIAAARLDWFEEPFPVDDVRAYRDWPLATPLAFGENAVGEDGIAEVIAMGAAVVQPDITKTGGITGGLAMGRRAIAAGRRLCFHMFGGAVGLWASAQLAAALPGADWVEMDGNPNPLLTRTLDVTPRVVDGDLILPPGPGLGVTLVG